MMDRRDADIDQGAGIGRVAAGEVEPYDIATETDRLLAGRARDVKLSGVALALYRDASWKQRSKTVRAWMIWISCMSVAVIAINWIVIPDLFWLGVLIFGIFVPCLSLVVFLVWSRPRHPAVEGLSVALWMATILAACAVLGASAGGYDLERYLTAALFIAAVGIIILGIELFYTRLLAASSITVYLVAQMFNQTIDWPKAFALTCFYGLGMYATVVARKTATIIAQRAFLMSLRDKRRSEALAIANRRLKELAAIDPLTGIANRRSAMDHIGQIWGEERTAITGVAMIMADIDHFKRLNDSRGHAAGDECIQKVAETITASIRTGVDIVSRHGGEEFLVVLTNATPALTAEIAERIRRNVAALGIANPGAENGIVTISLGIAFAEPGARPELVTKRADDALYEAKRRGRNRVSTAPVEALPAIAAPSPAAAESNAFLPLLQAS